MSKSRMFYPKEDAETRVAISISTSQPTLKLESAEPFRILVTARIIKSPKPEKPITVAAFLNPLDSSLSTRSFHNISCTFPPETTKEITVWPTGWPHYGTEPSDLRELWDFVTIPSVGTGDLIVEHELGRSIVKQAGVAKGERYTVSLTEYGLGTRWWACGAIGPGGDLEGKRFEGWMERVDLEAAGNDVYASPPEGEREVVFSEEPEELIFVVEHGEVEFEIE